MLSNKDSMIQKKTTQFQGEQSSSANVTEMTDKAFLEFNQPIRSLLPKQDQLHEVSEQKQEYNEWAENSEESEELDTTIEVLFQEVLLRKQI